MRNSKFEMHFAQQSCVFFKDQNGHYCFLGVWQILELVHIFPKKTSRDSQMWTPVPNWFWAEIQPTVLFQGQKITQRLQSMGRKLPHNEIPGVENDIFIPGAGMNKLAKLRRCAGRGKLRLKNVRFKTTLVATMSSFLLLSARIAPALNQ